MLLSQRGARVPRVPLPEALTRRRVHATAPAHG
jgi:hypothetical protein